MWLCATAYLYCSRMFTENKKAVIPVMSEKLPVFSAPATYEAVPATIEAVQWDGSAPHASFIIDWVLANGHNATYTCDDAGMEGCPGGEDRHHLSIRTLEGPMKAVAGTWIIRGLEGEFYPCKDSVFRLKYRQLRIEDELNRLVARRSSPAITVTMSGAGPSPATIAMMATRNRFNRG